jgi:copper chaperone CopZ
MKHEYKIGGMTCESCAVKVKSKLLVLPHVISVEVSKATDTATIEMSEHIPIGDFQEALIQLDSKYTISSINHSEINEQAKSWLRAYRPILLVFFYILLVTLLIQFSSTEFDLNEWMRHFMSAFFMVFSFFKILDLSGFADSYMSYDIIAKRWRSWGYVYAFIELGLGIAYMLNCCPLTTNITAFTVMTVSIIGVLQSVLNKRKIQCACLGAVFDLPMSTITIIEDALMILMSGYMILQIVN